MIQPNWLKKGDTIAIISTARKISEAELATSVKIFESWGLKVIFGPHLFCEDHQFAGTDEERLSDLQWAFDHPDLNAIICARGGYGTTRFIDGVNLEGIKKQPKWLCGFSDVTALVGLLNANDIMAMHSTMPIFFDGKASDETIDSLRKALFGEQLVYTSPKHDFNQMGNAIGQIIGGNLSIVNNIIGTASDMDWNGKILFLEDLDEYLYHIDRMLVHLDRAGKLKQLAGVIVGGMTDMHDNKIPFGKNVLEIHQEHLSKYDIPVCYEFPVGHWMENSTLICGMEAELLVDQNGAKLSFIPN